MSVDPLYLFVFIGLFTPGPNVVLLSAAAASAGFRATLPHLSGVVLGVGVVAAATALGVDAVLQAATWSIDLMRVGAAAWILYLAWRMAAATRAGKAKVGARPFGFFEALLFQWANPKLWAIAIAAVAGFGGELSPGQEAFRLGLAFSGINIGVCLFWTLGGSLLGRLMSSEAHWRIFMLTMAGGLAASAGAIFI